MFTVTIIIQSSLGPTALCRGVFSSYAAAQAWVASQTNPESYTIASAWNPVLQGSATTLVPASLTVGDTVVVYVASNASGVYEVYVYGPFQTTVSAQAYINATNNPNNYSVQVIGKVS